MKKITQLSRMKIRWLNTKSLVFLFLGLFIPFLSGMAQTYTYTGAVQTVTLPAGSYQIEMWGADGGSTTGSGGGGGIAKLGGKGGYSSGLLTLTTATAINVYVGGKGGAEGLNVPGGFNGGGNSGTASVIVCGSGGGASDIRVGGTALTDRRIVAGVAVVLVIKNVMVLRMLLRVVMVEG